MNRTFPANSFKAGTIMLFGLTVTKYKAGVLCTSVMATQKITIQEANAVVPQMAMSKKSVKVNADQDLLLQAVTLFPLNSSETYSYLWTCLGDKISLSALIQVDKDLSAINSPYLKIRANSLSPTGNYTIGTQIKSSGSPTAEKTTFYLKMNQKPSGGILLVTPTNGTEWQTRFNLTAFGWEDPDKDYPLTYVLYYQVTPDSGIIKLSQQSLSSTLITTLPAGEQLNKTYRLYLTLQVFDDLGSSANVTTSIFVAPGSKSDTEKNLLKMVDAIDTTDPISLMNSMGTAMGYLNETDGVVPESTKKNLAESLISSNLDYINV